MEFQHKISFKSTRDIVARITRKLIEEGGVIEEGNGIGWLVWPSRPDCRISGIFEEQTQVFSIEIHGYDFKTIGVLAGVIRANAREENGCRVSLGDNDVLEMLIPGSKFQEPEFPGCGVNSNYDSALIRNKKEALVFLALSYRPGDEDRVLRDDIKYPCLLCFDEVETYTYHPFDGLSLDQIIESLEGQLTFYKKLKEETSEPTDARPVLFFMKEDHTFVKLSGTIEDILLQLEPHYPTSPNGMIATKGLRPNLKVHASNEPWEVFKVRATQEIKAWLKIME